MPAALTYLGGRKSPAQGRTTDCDFVNGGVHPGLEECRLTMIGRIAALLSFLLARRRLYWVEISVEKAWSQDMLPRLFDLGDP